MCLSLIFTPLQAVYFLNLVHEVFLHRAGTLNVQDIARVMAPSESGAPARTKSLSCTRINFDSGTMYFLFSPSFDST